MACVGDEQKIQTLFHELRKEHQPLTPHFATMWHQARLGKSESRSSWSLSWVVASSVVVVTVCSVAFWITGLPPDSFDVAAISIPQQSLPVMRNPDRSSPEGSSSAKSRHHLRKSGLTLSMGGTNKLRTRTPRDHDGFIAISRWESPTDYLLHSPAEEILTSVSDLDQANAGLSVSRAN